MGDPESAERRSRIAGNVAGLVAVALWGLSFVATKAVLQEIRPGTVAFTRFAIGTLVLGVPVALRGLARSRSASTGRILDVRSLVLMGFFGVFVHQMLQVFGLQWTTATKTGWLIGIIPIWAAILGAAFLGERMAAPRVMGLVVGLAGALLVVTGGSAAGGLPALPTRRGDLLVLASTLNWAAYSVYGRRFLKGGGGLRTTAYSMGIGTALLAIPFVASGGWRDASALSGSGWLALLFLGVGCSGIAYLLWATALERLEASRVASWLYVEPFVTQLAALWLLGEPLTPRVAFGGCVVLAGVWLVQRRARV